MADLEKLKLSGLFWEGDKNEEGFFVYFSLRLAALKPKGFLTEGFEQQWKALSLAARRSRGQEVCLSSLSAPMHYLGFVHNAII